MNTCINKLSHLYIEQSNYFSDSLMLDRIYHSSISKQSRPFWSRSALLAKALKGVSIRYSGLLYVHSSLEIILMGKIELVALLSLSSRCLVIGDCCVALPRGVIGLPVVYDCGISYHTHYFLYQTMNLNSRISYCCPCGVNGGSVLYLILLCSSIYPF